MDTRLGQSSARVLTDTEQRFMIASPDLMLCHTFVF